jgi:dethiobiotin synthetase
VFVTGTDTGVGKTVVACALIRALRARGIRAGGMKPIETGVGPQRFALPAVPTVAARAEGRRVEVPEIDAAYARLRTRYDWLVVEGAGGMLVPAADGLSMADLAERLRLRLLLVARAALGTINHTRLSLEVARARGQRVVGLVICHAGGALSAADEANLDALRADPGVRVMGEIPPLEPDSLPPADCLEIDLLHDAVIASSRQ